MLTLITDTDIQRILFGTTLLAGVFLLLIVVHRRTSPQNTITIMQSETKPRKWRFRPGTWVVYGLQMLAVYATCLCRAGDAWVVCWRETKKDLLAEILDCED